MQRLFTPTRRKNGNSQEPVPTVPVLVEIVSAEVYKVGQEEMAQDEKPAKKFRKYSVYCVVKDMMTDFLVGAESMVASKRKFEPPKTIHQTTVCKKTNYPIWTVSTGSIFLMEVPEDCNRSRIQFELYDTNTFKLENKCLGMVSLAKSQLLEGDGKRLEYALEENDASTELLLKSTGVSVKSTKQKKKYNVNGKLFLRYRVAKPHEVQFMQKRISNNGAGLISANVTGYSPLTAGGILKSNRVKDSSQRHDIAKNDNRPNPLARNVARGLKEVQNIRASMKKDASQGIKYKVKPYNDPEYPNETRWMTKDEIKREALEPSLKWIQAGIDRDSDSKNDTVGQLNVEVIQCQGLPNTDTGTMGDFTDSFVAMAFEDNIVRTDVISDELSPRFMPWCQRAFAFSIQHPNSLLFIGVFDYDAIGNHTPIGRVVINLSRFRSNTVYLLQYKLNSDPNNVEGEGVITLRLSIEFDSDKEALEKTFKPPPDFRVNVPEGKAFRMIRYLYRGKVDMEQPTVASVKRYAYELLDYKDSVYLLIDTIASILLWRGRMSISKKSASGSKKFSLWFPIRSIVLFLTAQIAFARPSLIPALGFYLIGLSMYSVSYYKSKHPSPWERCKSVNDIIKTYWSKDFKVDIKIDPYEGYEQSLRAKEFEEAKILRIKTLISSLSKVASKLSQERKKLNPYLYLEATEEKSPFKVRMFNFLDSPLAIAHSALCSICSIMRQIRSIVTWEAYNYSFAIMVYCFVFGTVFVVLPINTVIYYTFKICTLTILGPWMKLVDIFYVMPYYPVPRKGTEKLEVKEPNFDSFFESPKFKMITKEGNLALEKGLKLKDMRELLFGKYMEVVPIFDSSRYTSIPQPNSSARVFQGRDGVHFPTFGYDYLPVDETEWQVVYGQKLYGDDILPSVVSESTFKTKES